MATKTFKIGLSNTDKQNMAQDVYERVLALTFAEYDSAETYNKGNFVVYNDLLYKCLADNVTGTWDATKWQQATLQDVVDDVENAVATVNNKANVDGNYPTMTVGMADNLTPYDESAGDDQDTPFILQATGTGNGSQPDFSTGSAGLMKGKQGNTVVVNQLYDASASTISSANPATTLSNGVFTINGTANQSKQIIQNNMSLIANHKYLVIANVKNYSNDNTGSAIQLYGDGVVNTEIVTSNINKNGMNVMLATPTTSGTANLRIRAQENSTWSSCTMSFYTIDLTQWFNGDIPQDLLDNPENFFRYYQGSLAYNEGTLVNANGRYIKCIGMNQWDGTNDVKAIPNATYYINGSATLTYKDKEGNTISSESKSNQTFVAPSNCLSIGVSGNGNISINLYYEDEPRCLTYEPYQVLTNNDTGNEVLRSAGSVKDTKAPDGTVHRLVGNRPYQSGDENDSSLITDGTTTNYPLAEPTTEQGTPYSENLVIDDFGSMDFGGTNGVPQGALIFYPVDYKAFVDTLYKYSDGTPSDLAKNSELNAKFESYLKSLSGYDASATQVLKNVEGTLTWVTEE